jgi:hypothetical protein
MARYSAGMTAAGAGTSGGTGTPIFGILATAAVAPKVREIGIFNTTAVACAYRVVAVTGGTPGATVTAYSQDLGVLGTPTCLAKQLWTAGISSALDTGYRIQIGAAIGSGGILTFGDNGLRCALGATIALAIQPIGTGQVCEVYFVWDE